MALWGCDKEEKNSTSNNNTNRYCLTSTWPLCALQAWSYLISLVTYEENNSYDPHLTKKEAEA